MKVWFVDVLKIACGVCLGYVLLLVMAFTFDEYFLPAFRIASGWLLGANI